MNAWRVHGARARVFVNFRKFSQWMARAWRARVGLTVYPPSRTLEVLAFDEYCRFDTSARDLIYIVRIYASAFF